MKEGDRVYTVRGGRKNHQKLLSREPGCQIWGNYPCGPFSGRVVRFSAKGCATAWCSTRDGGVATETACSSCSAVIRKDSDKKLVRCLLKNLRPYNTKAFRKVRKEWER